MNATDRFMAVLLARFDSAPLRHDYRRLGNTWARVIVCWIVPPYR